MDGNVYFVTSDEPNLEKPQRAPVQDDINATVTETTRVITSQKALSLPIKSDKLSEIKANMIKLEPKNVSYFLKEKIKFVRTLKIKATKKTKTKNN